MKPTREPLARASDRRNLAVLVSVIVFFLSLLARDAFAQKVTYYHNDALGSPVVATDATGAVVWKETYRPYGQPYLNSSAASVERIGFSGKPYDRSTGLSYVGARYYDPFVGRFLSIDPRPADEEDVHSLNKYAYANNNPAKHIDPDGHSPVDIAFLTYDVFKLAAAVYQGAGIHEAALDVAFSVVGVVVPAPGAGQALKAAKAVEKVASATASVQSAAKGARPNGGIAPKHGGTAHNDAIDQRVRELRSDPSVSNIRKNQQQVDVNGNKVGTNRPDLQYDQGGCHRCVEFDSVPRNSTRHSDVIRANDPKTKIELNEL